MLVERWRIFTREQKMSICIFAMCGFLALGISVYRLQRTIREPFLVEKSKALASKGLLGSTAEEEDARLKRTDTDGDGLSDGDEISVHRLNPNLKDTCGDGILDGIRVATGKQLSCAGSGGNVRGEIDVSGVTQSTSTFLSPLGDIQKAQDTLVTDFFTASQSATGTPSAAGASQFLIRDPAAIRAALKGRVDQAKLDALSDQKLLELYDFAVAEQKQALQTGREAGADFRLP